MSNQNVEYLYNGKLFNNKKKELCYELEQNTKEPKHIILSDNQPLIKGQKLCSFTCWGPLRIDQFIETDSSCDSVWNRKNVLEIDRCDGYTILWMYLKPLNHALKIVKLVGFMYIFHNKKVSA